jgi:hypothetical protein
MFHVKYILDFIFIELIIGTHQFNIYYIDEIDQNDNQLQHNCLNIVIKN